MSAECLITKEPLAYVSFKRTMESRVWDEMTFSFPRGLILMQKFLNVPTSKFQGNE